MPWKKKQKRDLRTELEKKGVPRYFKMSDDVEVRVLEFNLAENPSEYTIFLIPGFITVFQSWQKAMELLTKEFRVLYFESREKNTSRMPTKKIERKITLNQMARDIKEVVEQLELDKQKYIPLCSSTGGNILTHALAEKWLKPTGAIMVGPVMEFHLHWHIVFLSAIIPNIIIQSILKPIIKWYISKFYVNRKAEPEQLEKYMRALDECKMRKAMPLFRRMYKYQSWEKPPKIETKTLLLGASNDKMHATEETIRTHELIPDSIYVDLESNKATHSKPLVDELKSFIDYLEKLS